MFYFIESTSSDPFENLAWEEYLFYHRKKEDSYLLFWQNDKTVVIGRYQNPLEEIHMDAIKTHGIRLVRRNSGGGAVYHDLGNLNYSFLADDSYFRDGRFSLVQQIASVLNEMGIRACAQGRNDVMVEGKKVAGCAQFQNGSRVLHHGTLLIHSNLAIANQVLSRGTKFISSHAQPSSKSRISNIDEFLGRRISVNSVKQAILCCLEKNKQAVRGEIPEEGRIKIQGLSDKKYRTWKWNFGKTPRFNYCRRKKFRGGVVCLYAQIDSGRIDDVVFSGDFFCRSDIHELEENLKGAVLSTKLWELLGELHAGSYIYNISQDDIYSLFDKCIS